MQAAWQEFMHLGSLPLARARPAPPSPLDPLPPTLPLSHWLEDPSPERVPSPVSAQPSPLPAQASPLVTPEYFLLPVSPPSPMDIGLLLSFADMVRGESPTVSQPTLSVDSSTSLAGCSAAVVAGPALPTPFPSEEAAVQAASGVVAVFRGRASSWPVSLQVVRQRLILAQMSRW